MLKEKAKGSGNIGRTTTCCVAAASSRIQSKRSKKYVHSHIKNARRNISGEGVAPEVFTYVDVVATSTLNRLCCCFYWPPLSHCCIFRNSLDDVLMFRSINGLFYFILFIITILNFISLILFYVNLFYFILYILFFIVFLFY